MMAYHSALFEKSWPALNDMMTLVRTIQPGEGPNNRHDVVEHEGIQYDSTWVQWRVHIVVALESGEFQVRQFYDNRDHLGKVTQQYRADVDCPYATRQEAEARRNNADQYFKNHPILW